MTMRAGRSQRGGGDGRAGAAPAGMSASATASATNTSGASPPSDSGARCSGSATDRERHAGRRQRDARPAPREVAVGQAERALRQGAGQRADGGPGRGKPAP